VLQYTLVRGHSQQEPPREEEALRLKISQRSEVFFDMFDQSASNLRETSELLRDLVENYDDVDLKVHRIQDREHEGDEITHAIIQRLNTSFVTPIDREDIYRLATALDDVLDAIEAVADLHRKDPAWNGTWWGTRPALNPRPPRTVDWEGTPVASAAMRAALKGRHAAAAARAIRAAHDTGAIPAVRDRFSKESDAPLRVELFRTLEALKDPEAGPLASSLVRDSVRDDSLFAAAARIAAAVSAMRESAPIPNAMASV